MMSQVSLSHSLVWFVTRVWLQLAHFSSYYHTQQFCELWWMSRQTRLVQVGVFYTKVLYGDRAKRLDSRPLEISSSINFRLARNNKEIDSS